MFYWGRGNADGSMHVATEQVSKLYICFYWRRRKADGSKHLVTEYVSKLSIYFIGDGGMQTDTCGHRMCKSSLSHLSPYKSGPWVKMEFISIQACILQKLK